MKTVIPRAVFVFAFFFCLTIAVLAILYLNRTRLECVVRYSYECPMRLEGLGMFIANDHTLSGRYPSNLASVVKMSEPTPRQRRLHLHPLLCPGSATEPGSATNIDEWSDYLYVDWSKWYQGTNQPPGSYPMLYDRRISNHGGRGIYVLKVDHSVIWDGGGSWLAEFSERHPQYQIQLPQ
jgi:hypothetical protein